MADDPATQETQPEGSGTPAAAAVTPQLTQARVPIDEVDDALATPDAAGHFPIVVLPQHAIRIRNELVVAGVIALVVGIFLDLDFAIRGGLIGFGAILIVLGVFRSFRVPVPEGSQAILLKGGRFYQALGPGIHWVPPWIIASHFVTTRETPFDAPAMEIQTRDNVRTNVDIMMTFRIVEPQRFVFTISAPDFDQVCQATCQEVLRLLVREKDSDDVLDMGKEDNERLRSAIGAALLPYGVEVVKVVVTHVTPPVEFVASRESRRLATLQRQEEEARHALALLRQSDDEALVRQRIEARQKAIELEAANEVARLKRLESRIREYPKAMQWDVESRRLDVAASLASNTRAMVQVGPAADVAASLLMHTVPDDGTPPKGAADAAAQGGERPARSPRTKS
jgi:regulator of protease activity HflC (stomatin/prohibitin superfamily)